MNENDTIAALATAPGRAGLAIVRLSGTRAFEIADKLCLSTKIHPSKQNPGTFRLVRLTDEKGGSLGDAVVLVFRSPHSYTGEDVVEFQVHGGRQIVSRLLSALFAVGAMPAGPGEFTRRAFLNGRIGLEQAEAVMDLVDAQSERASRMAAEQLSGALGVRVNAIYDDLLALCADIEATLDFTDDDISGLVPSDRASARINDLKERLQDLANTVREGHLLREGALVVLAGPVNAGKSTLFNALLGTNRSIVNQQPGTTRDTIEETLVLDGIPIRLVDTAGLRQTENEIETEGIRRAEECLKRADLVLLLHEPSTALPYFGRKTAVLRIWTKSDEEPPPDNTQLAVSARTGSGLKELCKAIVKAIGAAAETGDSAQDVDVAISERHESLIRLTIQHLETAQTTYEKGAEESAVPVAAHLREAAESLGKITGRTYTEDLLNTVFGRFCVGK